MSVRRTRINYQQETYDYNGGLNLNSILNEINSLSSELRNDIYTLENSNIETRQITYNYNNYNNNHRNNFRNNNRRLTNNTNNNYKNSKKNNNNDTFDKRVERYSNNNTNNGSKNYCNITYNIQSSKTIIKNDLNGCQDIHLDNRIFNESYMQTNIKSFFEYYKSNFNNMKNKKELWNNIKTVMNRLNTEFYKNNNLDVNYFNKNIAICKTKVLYGLN